MKIPNLKFIHSWRPEQHKVLNRLDSYLADKRVHIVAAPGAGKTVLGIEIFNRLDLKTLVLSPTILVKDQWLDRLSAFMPENSEDEIYSWTSTNLSEPKFFTSSTYQSLHAFDKKIKKKQIKVESTGQISIIMSSSRLYLARQNG